MLWNSFHSFHAGLTLRRIRKSETSEMNPPPGGATHYFLNGAKFSFTSFMIAATSMSFASV
jgi:hypothetical protein